jgi:hypothetical protein
MLHILALAVVILFTVTAQANDWFWENPTGVLRCEHLSDNARDGQQARSG